MILKIGRPETTIHPNATWTLVLRKPGLFSLFFLSPRWTICLAIAAPHSTKRRPIRINCITVVFFEIADGWPWLNGWILCDISVITKDSILFTFCMNSVFICTVQSGVLLRFVAKQTYLTATYSPASGKNEEEMKRISPHEDTREGECVSTL